MNLFSAYQTLITSPEQLALCAQATSVEQLLQQLKQLWYQETLTDDQLLGELAACNQQIHDVDITALRGNWLPYRYQAKTRTIHWCLPQGHAIEPFHDQYIEHCRGQLLNQLITPKTSIKPLIEGQVTTVPLAPAGFIFHLSRCGSTLVSGCLAELNNTCVLSESPLLTELLLDDSLDEKTKQYLLPQLIHLQSITTPGRHNIIIKWNAWDIFFWPLIRSLYPQVPVLFLVRNPVEILASHQRSVGRHMAGDKSLAHLDAVFSVDRPENILDLRINILRRLISEMLCVADERGVLIVDYPALTPEKIVAIAGFFNVAMTVEEHKRIHQRTAVHSKELNRPFAQDSQWKRQCFNPGEAKKITEGIGQAYQRLIDRIVMQRDTSYAL